MENGGSHFADEDERRVGRIRVVGGDGKACLGAWFHPGVAGPGELADRTPAIPLREAAPCRSTQYKHR